MNRFPPIYREETDLTSLNKHPMKVQQFCGTRLNICHRGKGGQKGRMFAKKYVCDQRLGWDLFSRDWPRSFFTTGCHSFTGACLPKSPLPVHPLHWYCTCTAPCCTALHCIIQQYKAVQSSRSGSFPFSTIEDSSDPGYSLLSVEINILHV